MGPEWRGGPGQIRPVWRIPADVRREFLRECPTPAAMIARPIRSSRRAWPPNHPNTGELLAGRDRGRSGTRRPSRRLLDPGCEAAIAVIWHQVALQPARQPGRRKPAPPRYRANTRAPTSVARGWTTSGSVTGREWPRLPSVHLLREDGGESRLGRNHDFVRWSKTSGL